MHRGLPLLLTLALSAASAACGDDSTGSGGGDSTSSSSTGDNVGGNAGTGGSACPGGVTDTGAEEPTAEACPNEDPTGETCCTLDETYCIVYDCPPEGGNNCEKVLHTCGGELWGPGSTLSACLAASPEELEALAGTTCAGDPPCDITTGDGDGRFAICSGGIWYVFGNEG